MKVGMEKLDIIITIIIISFLQHTMFPILFLVHVPIDHEKLSFVKLAIFESLFV
jgi:hypothetical protein